MDEKELKKLIEKGETEEVEFKKSLSLKDEIGEAVSEFSNANGGIILIGVGDNKEIIGVQIGKKTLEDLANYIKENTDNHAFPKISVVEAESKNIVVIEVKESDEKPIFFKYKAHTRVGKSKHKLSASEIRKLSKESGRTVYWDEQICGGAVFEDIDEQKILQYMKERGIEKPKDMTLNDFLASIKAIHSIMKLEPTNGGILFFGKNPQGFYLQARVHCVRFDGNEITRNTLDELMCNGTLKDIVEKAEAFVSKNIRKYGFRTEISFKRIEKSEYPLRAIREAIVNALIHRDYREPSEVKMFIFNNRLEITNPGSFPLGTTPDNPVHKPRNPLLCEYMKDIHYIEKYGSGIYLMQQLCKEWGIEKPEYILDEYWTKIVFKPSRAGILLSEIKKEGIDINERQTAAVSYAFEHNSITNEEYQKINNIGRTTAKLELKDLAEKGLLEPKGRGKGTYYVIGATIK